MLKASEKEQLSRQVDSWKTRSLLLSKDIYSTNPVRAKSETVKKATENKTKKYSKIYTHYLL